ncbi:MAG: hypothetical protein MN733_12910 [Nitrososphaera sp.]|nr:hypothetical protein [Nitrososphaera sp.]
MGSMKLLLLEDDPQRIRWFRCVFDTWDIHVTNSVSEAIRLCEQNLYDRLYLDHDLGDFKPSILQDSGYDFAQWLAERPALQHEATVIIHSVNPGGAERMWQALSQTRDVAIVPFPILAKIEKGEN